MPTVHFRGTVLPALFNLEIHLPPILWKPRDPQPADPKVVITLNVANSQIDIACELEEFDFNIQGPMVYVRAGDIASAAVDCFCFARGLGQTIVLHTFVDANGNESPIARRNEQLPALCTAFTLDSDSYTEALTIVTREPALLLAMNDLVSTLTQHHLAPINCGRVIDGIRNLISPPGTDSSQGWENMRCALNFSGEYLKFVTNLSIAPRHGDRSAVSREDSGEAINRCWRAMNRFLEFRKRGNLALAPPDFPLL